MRSDISLQFAPVRIKMDGILLTRGKRKNCALMKLNGQVKKSEEVKRKLEIFWLPSYSPELNPDEYLNCDLKHGLSHKPAPRSVKEFRENVEKHMTMLQQTPSRIAKYFKHESIKYAA
jgi:hypothetical protein